MMKKSGSSLFQPMVKIKGIGATAKYAAKSSGPLEGAAFPNDDEIIFRFEMTSPDGKLRAFISRRGELLYNVFFDGEQIIADASMGLVVKGVNIGRDTLTGEPSVEKVQTEYTDRGNDTKAVDRHNAYMVPVRHVPTGLEYQIEVRLWNDGFGFRFVFRPDMRFLINDETTTFRLPVDSVCWYQTDVRKLQGKTMRQETRYLPQGIDFACLTLFELKNDRGYVMITEANLKNYPGAALRSKGRGELEINLWDSGSFYAESFVSPWRLIIACRTLDDLVNCKVIKNAAEPEHALFAGTGTDWIVPGKAAWSYFVNVPVSRRFETVMLYNNYAHEMGYPYSVIDSGWRRWGITEGQAFRRVAEVVRDASVKGVGIFVWKSVRMGPYFSLYRKWFFRKCRKTGVRGIKFDHIECESQFMINLYRRFLEEAAQNHLMVLFHNPQKPTGLSRTYPNLLSMEAIRGMQSHCDPDDTAILPFTRLVAGDADYTPLCFTVPERRGDATIAHMLANTVIMTSSFLTLSEDPHVVSQQIFADFIRQLPTTWDKTIALPQSKLGDVAVFARRKGDDWYIAAQNSDKGVREVTVRLDFLDEDAAYELELFFDDKDQRPDVKRISGPSRRGDAIKIAMLSGGGFAGKFAKTALTDKEIEDV